MKKQLVISIGREFGSGGYRIGKKLAEKLGFEFFDRNLLDELACQMGVDTNDLSKYDEKLRNRLFSRTVRGMSNSPEQNIAEMQFALLKSKAADGDSFVVVGRCADEIFNGICDVATIFITASEEDKIKEIVEQFGVSEAEAKKKMVRHDKKRRAYHDYFCKRPWGEVKSYDLCLNASVLGVDGTADLLYEYVQQLLNK